MRRAVDLLTRLERHALDRQRLELQAVAGELEHRRTQLVQLGQRLVLEHALAFELPGGPQPLAAYAGLAQARTEALRAEEARLIEATARAEAGLRERARHWKALDLVGQALRAEAAARAQRDAAAAIAEAAQLRAAGRIRTPGPA